MNERWRDAVRTVQGVQSKYKRLVKAMAADIESGALASGERLPPQREVAADLAISVQTVTNAYKELERQGLIRCEVGRGSFVAARVTETMSNYMLDTAERSVVDFSIARIVHTPEHDAMWRKVCATLVDHRGPAVDSRVPADRGLRASSAGGRRMACVAQHAGEGGDAARHEWRRARHLSGAGVASSGRAIPCCAKASRITA